MASEAGDTHALNACDRHAPRARVGHEQNVPFILRWRIKMLDFSGQGRRKMKNAAHKKYRTK
ncbi:hypothetical protein DWV00_19555 [Trinickia dinghuensis]|uniref:Uncharacterized protein n=1 Tax=Trinickia dinghuensis TaxID=2291023 RepID=A0A3D8JX81_9BURK|nr:hypothetical protein DWV00_19555 [Trinickia dinghuensis]